MARIEMKSKEGRMFVTSDPQEAAHFQRTRGYVVVEPKKAPTDKTDK